MPGDGGLNPEAFRAALVDLLPPGVALAVWGVDVHEEALYPDEEKAVRNAVPSRRREFARGRACARHALARLGRRPGPIGVGPHRQPVWPREIVGSVTHAGGWIAAAVASSDELVALGIDVEVMQRLETGVRDRVMQATDRLELGEATPVVVVSAKESVFKALFPGSGVWMAYDAVSLRHGSDAGSLRVAPSGISPAAPGVEDLRGGYRVSPEWVTTGFWRQAASTISRHPTKRY